MNCKRFEIDGKTYIKYSVIEQIFKMIKQRMQKIFDFTFRLKYHYNMTDEVKQLWHKIMSDIREDIQPTNIQDTFEMKYRKYISINNLIDIENIKELTIELEDYVYNLYYMGDKDKDDLCCKIRNYRMAIIGGGNF